MTAVACTCASFLITGSGWMPKSRLKLCSALHVQPVCILLRCRLTAYSALFDHGLASKSDQRFASIRSTGNLTFSTAF
ncbi:hypothetical protein GBT17_19590 [Escherichia coli]|nr:hypothetical protein [Escherichia coli]EFF9713133.1 hypothetical protein [Escherichia coli]NNR79055.1 hypothetical protein [Escherichia coli]